MKRFVLAGLAFTTLAAVQASAADLPRSMPYRAPAYITSYNWTGFYIGANTGYVWGSNDGINLRGGFIGGQIGYNWQAAGSPWVLGVEVDSAWADLGRTDTFIVPFGVLSASSSANYVGSARLRGGYAFDRTMVYLTGGLGWLHNELAVNATVGPFALGVTDSRFHVGGVVGAGIEHAFAPNWSGKVEYLYSMYSTETYFGGIGGGVSASPDTHTLRVGVNYQFRQ